MAVVTVGPRDYSIPDDLFGVVQPAVPSTASANPDTYSLNAAHVDIGAMLQAELQSSPLRLKFFVESAFSDQNIWGPRSLLWAIDKDASPSVNSPERLQQLANRRFNRLTGAIRFPCLPEEFSSQELKRFFLKREHQFPIFECIENRGASYYVAIDQTLSPQEKLEIMKRDMLSAFELIEKVDRKSLDKNGFFGYLAVLDYLKGHSLTAFNALTFREREGYLHADEQYMTFKGATLKLARLATCAYYQHLLGREITMLTAWPDTNKAKGLSELKRTCIAAFDYMRNIHMENRQFKLQEVDHPLVIALNAHQNVLRFPETEVVIGLPFGGLQPAIVSSFAYDLVHGKSIKTIPIPLSTHGGKERNDHLSADQLVELFLRDEVRGKHVMVTEDNSNTGHTAQVISDALWKAGAASVRVCLVETDPIRALVKQGKRSRTGNIANFAHPDWTTAAGIVPIRQRSLVPGKLDEHMRKLYARIVSAWFHGSSAPTPRSPNPTKKTKPGEQDGGTNLRLAV